MMEWIRRRDKAVVAIVVTVLGAAAVLVSVNLDKLPFISPTKTYAAQFANATGLQAGDDVRVAGISVGAVDSIKVEQDHVVVRFSIEDDIELGSTSGASIELATVLGSLFLQVESAGPGTLAEDATIPLNRTSVPFTLIGVFNKVGEQVIKTDLPTFQRSLKQLAATLEGISPKDVSSALRGITRISTAITSRQSQISKLIADANTIFKTLSGKRDSIVRLMSDSDTFVRMLNDRRDAVNSLLRNTAQLSNQVTVLIKRNGAKLGAVLDDLDKVTGVLADDSTQLTRAISMLGQFSTNITNAAGSGPWVDLLLVTALHPDTIIAACGKNPTPGCGH